MTLFIKIRGAMLVDSACPTVQTLIGLHDRDIGWTLTSKGNRRPVEAKLPGGRLSPDDLTAGAKIILCAMF